MVYLLARLGSVLVSNRKSMMRYLQVALIKSLKTQSSTAEQTLNRSVFATFGAVFLVFICMYICPNCYATSFCPLHREPACTSRTFARVKVFCEQLAWLAWFV